MGIAHLIDRGVVRVAGEEARGFLDGLVTCDMDAVGPDRAGFGALLSPQGKILFDFLVTEAPAEAGGGFYLDTAAAFAPDLAKKLTFYRLRAKVQIEILEALVVVAGWDETPRPADEFGLVFEDPRLAALGWRAIVAREDLAELGAEGEAAFEAYHAHRIALGVPEAGKDFLFQSAFPHEALMDDLHGVAFDKGCFVGQEVVSRMQHRGTARTRILRARYPDGFAAEEGSEVRAGAKVLGESGSAAKGIGLVMVRVDRASDALASGEPITSGGMTVVLEKPAFARFAFPVAAATSAA